LVEEARRLHPVEDVVAAPVVGEQQGAAIQREELLLRFGTL